MRTLTLSILLIISVISEENLPWSASYQTHLVKEFSKRIPRLSTYPTFLYPNEEYTEIIDKYPEDQILIFGYGSLMNKASAKRSLNQEAIDSMKPVVALGFKRIFNYNVGQTTRWGPIKDNERAMLNIQATPRYNQITNGVLIKVNAKDLENLVIRETGYDLIPILVADWNDVVNEKADIKFYIAYTFLVPDELRNGIDYTQTSFYPVRGYLRASENGAAAYGQKFLNVWREHTYLSDGTTKISDWDQETFEGILDTSSP